jgi:disulfide bond formation protein DsbB
MKPPALFYHFPLYSGVVAALALAVAGIAQYGFDLRPCPLCVYQRIPYIVIVGIGLLSAFYQSLRPRQVFMVITGLWVLSLVLGLYHSGVEAGLWTFPACANTLENVGTVAELEAKISQATIVPCDKPAFVWMGFSMADMNVILSTLMVFCGLFSLKINKENNRSRQTLKKN